MMKKECKKVISILLLFVMVFSIFTFNDLDTVSASSRPILTYNSHLQNIGWQGWVSEGSVSGTTGQSRQMEALSIKLSNNGRSMITYRAHVKDYGWLNWVQSGGIAGTTGKSCRLEGIQIKLNHEFVSRYDIYYRVHIANYGWLGWAKNGATAGSEGIGMPAEAIQIKIVNKGEKFSEGGKAAYTRPDLNYRAHCANVGWMNTVQDAQMAGTTGQARRMEALIINLSDFQGKSGISYRTHVSNIGWQSWKKSGQMMGTTGQSRQMEAVQIKLSPSLTPCFNIYYRVHVTNVGWLGWAKNGETAGSTGQALAIEAIEIKLVNKDSTIITGGSAVYSAPSNSSEQQSNSYTTNSTTGYAQPISLSGARWSSSTTKNAGCQHDIQAANIMGQPVYAIDNGTINCVQIVSDTYGGRLVSYGNVIYFTSADGRTKATYAHLNGFSKCNATVSSSYTIQKSQSDCRSVRKIKLGPYNVNKGELIGYVGTTGYSTGPHLHFELFINGVRKNPPQYVKVN